MKKENQDILNKDKKVIWKYITLADYDWKDIFKQQTPILPEALFWENQTQPYATTDITIVVERVRSMFGDLLVDRRVVEHILSLVNEWLGKQRGKYFEKKHEIQDMQQYIDRKREEITVLNERFQALNEIYQVFR